MTTRRLLAGAGLAWLSGCAATAAPPAPQAPATPPLAEPVAGQSFEAFLAGLRAEARRAGIRDTTLNSALTGLTPNPRVIELDRRQAEGALAWPIYRDRMVSETRITNGRRAYADNRATLARIEERYGVSPRMIVAIWGVETNYGSFQGGTDAIQSLATLAWEGRRGAYFRAELLAALRILDQGHIRREAMRGSWAGALGHPQFMPTNFERLAVDFDGDGRRDIWESPPDALASIANYFRTSGWRPGEPWGREVRLPAGFDASAGLDQQRPTREWARLGVRAADGSALPPSDLPGSVIVPRGGDQAFLVHHNWRVIRRYNPSTSYALAVALISDRVA
jgi:membrane-bound lytic murein transglycosylase B